VVAVATLLLLAAAMAAAPTTEGLAPLSDGTGTERGDRFPGVIGQDVTVPPPSSPSSPPVGLTKESAQPDGEPDPVAGDP